MFKLNSAKLLPTLAFVASVLSLVSFASFIGRPLAAMPDNDTPFTVLYSGVNDFALVPQAVYWHESPSVCNATPKNNEAIGVMPLTGSLPRSLYWQNQACGTTAILSNLIVDQKSVYWIGLNGLMRLPRDANETDIPQIVNALITGPGELVDAGDRIYTLSRSGGNTAIAYVRKDNNGRVPITTLSGDAFALSFDGDYLYYLIGSTLIRLAPGGNPSEIAFNVTSYHADGRRTNCQGGSCLNTHLVFIGQNDKVVRYDNLDGTTKPSYTSPDNTALILGVISDGEKLFLYERRTTVCDPLCTYSHNLVRAARNGIPTAEDGPIYSTSDLIGRLALQDDLLYWREFSAPPNGQLKRLSTAAGPSTLNLQIKNVLVTQGIQDLNNNVPLIENRRTFVRVFAQSNGATAQGVTAFLYGSWDGVNNAGPLLPVNPAGTKLNVSNNLYLLDDINGAFLFELPWEWTTKNDLRLRVQLNPYQLPLETNYADNSLTVGPFDIKPSGRLAVQFVSFGFALNNQTYYPSLLNDVFGNYSWIRRVYPLSSTPGFMDDPSPGFRPNNWLVFDAGLGSRVNRTAEECTKPPYIIRDQNNNIKEDKSEFCASAYTNAQMQTLRQENKLADTLFMYGMIRDLGGNLFPRGQADVSYNSSGPAGPGWVGFYAGHEIGHTLGRGHPLTGNGQCGLAGADPIPSYPNARIGPASGVVQGFDVGDPSYGIPRAVLPGTGWVDMMAYCQPQWISDQNYKNLFAAIPAAMAAYEISAAAGDPTLMVTGIIDPETNTAAFTSVRSGEFPLDPSRPSQYSLRLLNAGGTVLAQRTLAAQELEHGPGWLGFSQVVEFPAETRRIDIVRAGDNKALASRTISATAPALNGLTIGSTITPTVTLNWNAADADGDPLRFDIYYSRDEGTTFRPLQLNLTGSSTTIPTAELGGGSKAIFRVIANDGARADRRDSAPVALPNQPPQVRILSPGENEAIVYGQTVNLIGEAFDLQDGGLSNPSLLWTVNGEPFGEGALQTLPILPPGTYSIGLRATNSVGLSSEAEVTVEVADDLAPPAPYLSAAPASVAWHIESGEQAIQEAEVVLTNVGDGMLTWQANSTVSWLSVTPTSGGSGVTLEIRANPAGLQSNRIYETIVSVKATGGNGVVLPPVSIPVALAIGNLREGSIGPAGTPQLFLPFIRR
jgi:hypothetical protein